MMLTGIHSILGVGLIYLFQAVLASEDCPNLRVTGVWATGLDSFLTFTLDHATHGWEINLKYARAFGGIYCSQALVETQDNQNFRLTSLGWDGELTAGQKFELQLQPYFTSNRPFLLQADIDGQDICGFMHSTPKPTTTTTTTTTTTATTTTTTTTATTTHFGNDCVDVVGVESVGADESTLSLHLTPTSNVHSWTVNVDFTQEVRGISSPRADVGGAGASWVLSNKPGDGSIPVGSTLELYFSVQHPGSALPGVRGLRFNGVVICGDE